MTYRAEWTDHDGGGWVVVDGRGVQVSDRPKSSRESVEDLADAMNITARTQATQRQVLQ